MINAVKITYYLIIFVLILYLVLPNSNFPIPPVNSLQSNEPADQETPLRRSYFTDYTRDEITHYYKGEIEKNNILSVRIPSINLNYPPEEAQFRIRDQTRSSFLEEIVYPLRESFYINGFEPKEDKDAIYVDGKLWRQKITIRQVPSSLFSRLLIGLLIFVITKMLKDEVGLLKRNKNNLFNKSLEKLKFINYGWFWPIAKYSLASILIAVPLYPKFPFFRVPGTFVSIRLEDLLISFAALIVLILVLWKYKSIMKNNIFKAIILFLIVAFTSCLSAIFITKDVSTYIVILHWLRRIEYFIPFFLAFFVSKRKVVEMDYYLKIILIVIPIVFVYGLGQRYFSWPIIITQNEEYAKGVALRWIPGSHINSTFAGHYDLASFLVLMIPIVTCGFFMLKGFWSRLILGSAFFSGLWLIVNSASRIWPFLSLKNTKQYL